MGPPVSLYFMHVNTRHHSLAIAQGHVMSDQVVDFYGMRYAVPIVSAIGMLKKLPISVASSKKIAALELMPTLS